MSQKIRLWGLVLILAALALWVWHPKIPSLPHFKLLSSTQGRIILEERYYVDQETIKEFVSLNAKEKLRQREYHVVHFPQHLNNIYDMVFADGKIWAGTYGGLLVIDPVSFQWKVALDGDRKLLSSLSLLSYHPPFLWAAGNSVHRLDLEHGKSISWDIQEEAKNRSVRTLTAGPDGAWTSDGTPDVWHFSTRHRWVEKLRFPADETYPDFLGTTLFYDDGWLWASNHRCILRWNPCTGETAQWPWEADTYSHENSHWTADLDHVYFGMGTTPSGNLRRFDKKQGRWETLSPNLAFPIAKQTDLIWVGASYDLTPASRFALRYLKDLGSEWKTGFVYEGALGLKKILPVGSDLWFATNKGLLKWTPGNKVVERFTVQDSRAVPGTYVPLIVSREEIPLSTMKDQMKLDIP